MRRRRLAAALLGAGVLTGCWIERRPVNPAEEARLALHEAVESMLQASAAAWNRGDFEGFIDDYLPDSETTYLGGGGLVVGYDSIGARFAPWFQPGVERGRLHFEELRVRRLGTEHALATARFVLTGPDGRRLSSGPFTLVLRRVEGNWRILHDHTSSDPPPADAEREES